MTRLSINRRQFGVLAGAGAAVAGLGLSGTLARAATEGKRMEYITFGLQYEFQVSLVDGIKKRAAEAGIELNVIDGKGDPNLQITQLLDAITKQPDVLLVNPIDAALLVGGVKKANAANIPVFILENPPAEGTYLGFVDFDNEAGGAMGADKLAELVGGEGSVLEALGSTGSAQAIARHKGFSERVKSTYPKLTVKELNTEWSSDTTYKMVLDAFTQDPDIKGMFSASDEMLRGTVSALRQINRLLPPGEPGHVALVGLDGAPLALDRIREGTQQASVGQSTWAMGGGGAMEQVIPFLEGREFTDFIRTQPVLITKENVDDPSFWGNAARG